MYKNILVPEYIFIVPSPIQLFVRTLRRRLNICPLVRRPHVLQLFQYQVVRIKEPLDAVLHAGFLVLIELAARDLRWNAFLEADVGEGVDRCRGSCQPAIHMVNNDGFKHAARRCQGSDEHCWIVAFCDSDMMNCCSSCLSRSESFEGSIPRVDGNRESMASV